MMKIYGIKVFCLGADSPSTFYFDNEADAIACQNYYDRADDIFSFESDDSFPMELLCHGEY